MNKKFQGAGGQIFFLTVLLYGLILLVRREMVNQGEFFGKSTVFWIWISVFGAVIHQVYIFFVWRFELYGNHLTKNFGKMIFPIYAFIFAILLILRPVLIFIVALSNQGSLPIHDFLKWSLIIIGGAITTYSHYSVVRYFKFKRAFGIDHFDPSYKNVPFVKGGLFKYTNNSMYVFGFILLWLPGIYFESSAAILAALFQHTYIWVHFFFLEKIDFKEIYNSK